MSSKSSTIDFPISKTNLKTILRKGLTKDNRIKLWPVLPSFLSNQNSYNYNLHELLNNAESLSISLNEPLLDFKLQDKRMDGKDSEYTRNMISKLAYVLQNTNVLFQYDFFTYDIFLRILFSVLERLDVCYLVTKQLLTDKERLENT